MITTLARAKDIAFNKSKDGNTYVVVGYPGAYSVMTYTAWVVSTEDDYIIGYCSGKVITDGGY